MSDNDEDSDDDDDDNDEHDDNNDDDDELDFIHDLDPLEGDENAFDFGSTHFDELSDSDISNCSCDTEVSFAAPCFSPCIITAEDIFPGRSTEAETFSSPSQTVDLLLNTNSKDNPVPTGEPGLVDDNIDKNTHPSFAAEDILPGCSTESETFSTPSQAVELLPNTNSKANCEDDPVPTGNPGWKGFKLVGDNIDKNIHPSFHRYDNKTNSLHHFHYYALLDCVDLSACSENLPTSVMNLKQLLVGQNDIQQLESDAIVLFSRYHTNLTCSPLCSYIYTN